LVASRIRPFDMIGTDVAPTSESQPQTLVVFGASAGGIETLSTVLQDMPKDFRAPIVVGMHISPNRISRLGDVLARRSALPVVTLENQARLEPGKVFVVPARRNVEILDGHARLTPGEDGPQPSVDLLFRSAAEAYGENLIAIVLSGTGSDGALGARFVKMAGGTVIVQNPDTAAYPGMPLSLSQSDVDVTANLDRIAALVTQFASGEFAVPSVSEHSSLR